MMRAGLTLALAAFVAACGNETPAAPAPRTTDEAAAIAKAEAMLDETEATEDTQ